MRPMRPIAQWMASVVDVGQWVASKFAQHWDDSSKGAKMIKREYRLTGRLALALAVVAIGGVFATIFMGNSLRAWPLLLFLTGVIATIFGIAFIVIAKRPPRKASPHASTRSSRYSH